MKTYILYNPYANNGNGEKAAKEACKMFLKDEHELINLIELTDRKAFFEKIEKESNVVIAGGDGTLSRFVTSISDYSVVQDLYYVPTGTGNDFASELSRSGIKSPIKLKKYITNLPKVTVNNKTYRFINGVGYGIDGYCCEVGDELRKKSDKPVNYTSIAIKGLLFHYKPCDAEVIVDGVSHHFHKVWIAPTMHGKMYGGGMIPTPDQNRLDPNGTLSVMLYYGVGKLKALMVFPSIFKGEHIKHKEMVKVLTGKDIIVRFTKPQSLQIDGETILGVSEYHAESVL